LVGQLLKLSTMQCPTLAKTWFTLANWCYKWGRKAVDNAAYVHNLLCSLRVRIYRELNCCSFDDHGNDVTVKCRLSAGFSCCTLCIYAFFTPRALRLCIMRTDRRPTFLDVNDHNFGCVQDRFGILFLKYGFLARPIQRGHLNLPPTDPCCHGNEIWVKIGYNSACMRDISKILASNRGFWSRTI